MSELAVILTTTRFGDIEVAAESLLRFPEGLIGLGGSEYALIPAPRGPFVWCQSASDPGVALVLTRPERFFPHFRLELAEADAERVGLDGPEPTEVFVTVSAAPLAADCTANLKAPIVAIGTPGERPRRAHQVLNQADGAQLRTPLF
jgi:flagellar assembly factor FliW